MIQLLVYPFFGLVGEGEFKRTHDFHMSRISWIVVPFMTLELLTGVLLYIKNPSAIFLGNLIAVACLWIFTGLVSVPTHNKLDFGSESSKQNLVAANWPRTLLWSVRSLLLIAILIGSSN